MTNTGNRIPESDAVLRDYYEQRAGTYDEVYRRDDPVDQAELNEMAADLRRWAPDRSVLEIACGTGHWTNIAAESARHVVAVDASPAMLRLAAQRVNGKPNVSLVRGDAYRLCVRCGGFDGAIAMFWLSHIPRDRRGEFLSGLHAALRPGARVMVADSVYAKGDGGPLLTPVDSRDTLRRRSLPDGSIHDVVKNYFQEAELRTLPGVPVSGQRIVMKQRYWWMSYELAQAGAAG